jgi:hypothetical protein
MKRLTEKRRHLAKPENIREARACSRSALVHSLIRLFRNRVVLRKPPLISSVRLPNAWMAPGARIATVVHIASAFRWRCSTRVGRVDVELLERQSALAEAKLACG